MKKIPILKAFDNYSDEEDAVNAFIVMHKGCLVDYSSVTITLPHTKVFFRVFKEPEDVYNVAGLVFSQVDLHGKFSDHTIAYLRSRIRYPFTISTEEVYERVQYK